MPSIACGELPPDLGLLRVAEVEAVREADRLAADARDVPRRLEHRERAAREGIEPRDATLAVERDRKAAHRRPQPQHRSIEPRPANRPRPDELVVAAEDELAAAQRGRGEQLDERVGGGRRADDLALRSARRAATAPTS